MDRRAFLTRLGLIAGGLALEQAIPFGRVWSFPKEIVIPARDFTREALGLLINDLKIAEYFNAEWEKEFAVGSLSPIRFPQRFFVTTADPMTS